MNNIKNPSFFRTKVANKCVENADHQTSACSGFGPYNFGFCYRVFKLSYSKYYGNFQHLPRADVVIEAKFKDDTVRFEFCVSRGLEKLVKEVGTRLNLKIGKFILKYVDDDDDDDYDDYGFGLISLTCDEDWHLCMKSMKSLGKTTVQVSVHLVSE